MFFTLTKKGADMNPPKKAYVAPELKVYGSVEVLTQWGGGRGYYRDWVKKQDSSKKDKYACASS